MELPLDLGPHCQCCNSELSYTCPGFFFFFWLTLAERTFLKVKHRNIFAVCAENLSSLLLGTLHASTGVSRVQKEPGRSYMKAYVVILAVVCFPIPSLSQLEHEMGFLCKPLLTPNMVITLEIRKVPRQSIAFVQSSGVLQ